METGYLDQVLACSEDNFQKDMIGQIWRNSQILCDKYINMKRAIISMTLAPPFERKFKLTDVTTNTVELATELTMAWLSNPNTRTSAEDVPAFLKSMYDAVIGLSTVPPETTAEEAAPEFTGAVSARKSLANPDVIISMIDGKPYKTLTRHLSTNGLTPAEYRERYALKADYPMTAPSYSAMRRDMAKKIGLGRKPGQKTSAKSETPAPTTKRGRPPKVAEPS